MLNVATSTLLYLLTKDAFQRPGATTRCRSAKETRRCSRPSRARTPASSSRSWPPSASGGCSSAARSASRCAQWAPTRRRPHGRHEHREGLHARDARGRRPGRSRRGPADPGAPRLDHRRRRRCDRLRRDHGGPARRATPLGTVLAGLLFGALSSGGVQMQASVGTPAVPNAGAAGADRAVRRGAASCAACSASRTPVAAPPSLARMGIVSTMMETPAAAPGRPRSGTAPTCVGRSSSWWSWRSRRRCCSTSPCRSK